MGLVLWIILRVFYGLPVLFRAFTGVVWIYGGIMVVEQQAAMNMPGGEI